MKRSLILKTLLATAVLGFAFHQSWIQKPKSRGPAAESAKAANQDLNDQFHHLSQILRTQQELQAELERELPNDIFQQKCNNSKLIEKEVHLLVKFAKDHSKTWKNNESKKVNQLLTSLENMKKISSQLVLDCSTPVPNEHLVELRSEVMSAGFLYQNLSNPFEVSENR